MGPPVPAEPLDELEEEQAEPPPEPAADQLDFFG
jgi:hypothetical protein